MYHSVCYISCHSIQLLQARNGLPPSKEAPLFKQGTGFIQARRKFENLMADLAAYLVSEYDIEPRDAAGLVMNSPQTQALYSSEEPITEQRVKALAEELLKEGKA